MWGRPTEDPELESEKERAALEEEIRAQGPCGFRRNGSRKDRQGHEHCRKVQERRVGHEARTAEAVLLPSAAGIRSERAQGKVRKNQGCRGREQSLKTPWN